MLKRGGHVILSVPCMYFPHGWPHDYFRLSRYGLASLAETAGFTVVRQVNGGGIAIVICHSISMALTATLRKPPRAPSLSTLPATALYKLGRLLDRLDRDGLFSRNIHMALAYPA